MRSREKCYGCFTAVWGVVPDLAPCVVSFFGGRRRTGECGRARVKTGGERWRRAADNGAAESLLSLSVLCAVAASRTGGLTYTKFPFYARRTAATGCEYPFGEARFCMLGFAGFFVLLPFLLFVAACFGFSEHCFGKPAFRPWEGRGRVPVPVLSSFGGFSFLLVRKLSGKYLFRRVVAQERKPQRRTSFDGRRMAGPFPFRFFGVSFAWGAHRFSGQRMLLPSGS